MPKKAVLLVGHGALASDCPPELVAELKKLEARRGRACARQAELDAAIRHWPRTPATDPYQAGLEAIASALRAELKGRLVKTAYNEFCAPTIEGAFEELVSAGARQVTVIATMYTRGGVHSEREIPEVVKALRRKHPGVAIRYAWPFPLKNVAAFLARQIRTREKTAA